MAHILVTGGSGYIGGRFVERATARGHTVTLLGRQAGWALGDPAPEAAWQGVEAVVHLAHDWSAAEGAGGSNVAGTARLLAEARRHGVRRFVLASSVAARPDAQNRYGRIKAEVEGLLQGPDEVAARIGLVYGGPPAGLWGTLCRVTGLSPVLPMIGIDRLVQPIHRDEVCDGLLALVERAALDRPAYGLATAQPIAFGRFLELVARCRHRRRLHLIGLPLPLIMGVANLVARVPGLPDLRERILGLAGVPTIETAADLAALGLTLRDVAQGLELEV